MTQSGHLAPIHHLKGTYMHNRTMCDCSGYNHSRDCLFFDDLLDDEGPDAMLPGNITVLGGTSALYEPFDKCHHHLDPVRLPSGLTVYASAWSSTPYNRIHTPDVGCYFDGSWMPTDCFAYFVGWRDFGLPTIPDLDVARTARAVLGHAGEYGETVEIGCLGAHGRTGTFLALLVMMDTRSYGYKRAIEYVRDNHCKKAVETKVQETWLRRMSGQLRKGEL